jgi:hypothetical protein
LFVVHTPFQRLTADHMVRSIPTFAKADNILVLDCHPGSGGISEFWKEIVKLDPPVGGSVVGRGKVCRKALRIISAIADDYARIELLLSDIDWPLNNALFGLARKERKPSREMSICNFPDGMGSLMLTYPDLYQQLRNIVKASLSFFGGSPYYLHGGDRMGLEVSDKVYSLMPSALPPDIRRETITIPMIEPTDSRLNPEGCLFVGQNYERFMSETTYRALCRRAAEFTHGLGYKDLLYKPHHFATSSVEVEIFQQHGFEVVRDSRPVEEMFMTDQVACVVSYNSSALVHLRMMFGERIRCISCCGRRALEATHVQVSAVRAMLDLFERCGVECYE